MDIQEIGSKFEDLLLANPDFDESLLEKDEDGCYEDSDINSMYQMFEAGIEAAEFKEIRAAKAQAVPEGFGLFDGDTLTYSNGYSINCSFDDEFDCHIFDVYQNEDCVKDGMTQLEQAHCLVLSMIKLDAKDSMIEAQEQKG